jgi:flagellar hook-associated protein 1 FlgK
MSVTLDDVSDVVATDYLVIYDGSQWSALRNSDGEVTTGPGPLSVDGMTISFTGTAVVGDSFVLEPTRQGASMFNMALGRPADIALASPVTGSVASANAGDARISQLTVTSTTGLPLVSDVVLTFDENAMGAGVPGFLVAGSVVTSIAYDPATEKSGKTFTLPDAGNLQIELSGVPLQGDQLSISNNASGVGDNRNALAMIDLQGARILEQGNSTYQNVYGNLVADVGTTTRQAQINSETETRLLQQAIASRESVSGVNLDEEAADLLRFQQAYQAAAQMIAVADTMFQTLLSATGR